jgi:hypothetical protein
MSKGTMQLCEMHAPFAVRRWFLCEVTFTTDGPRTRVCDGRYESREEAEAAYREREDRNV